MRHSTWLGPMVVLALGACSEGQRLSEITGRSEALAGPFDPLICTLGDACDEWGAMVEAPSAEPTPCAPLDGEALPAAWHVTLDGIPCPLGRCSPVSVELAVEPSGSFVAMFGLQLPAWRRFRQAGYWLARYDGEGVQLGSHLWDFAIPPPGVDVERRVLLLSSPSGEIVLGSSRAIVPGEDEPRPLTLQKLGEPEPKPQGARVSMPLSQSLWRSAIGPEGEIIVASYVGGPDEMPRSVLTLHDRRGQVVWNRPWPEDQAIDAVQVDAAGRITLQVAVGSWFERTTRIVRLDLDGRVIWQRVVAQPDFYVQSAVDRQGNAYVLPSRWTFEGFDAHLERIGALGQSSGLWSIDELGTWPELHEGHDGAWVVVRSEWGEAPELWALPFGAASDASLCEGTRHLWPGTWESFFDSTIALGESAQGEVYVAATRVIFELGGAP